MILNQASQTLDHFPSLKEIHSMVDYIQGNKPSGTIHGRSLFKDETYIAPEHRPISPWPTCLEALMLQIASGNAGLKGWGPAIAYNNLTEDEAWKLYENFLEKDFDSDLAKQVIERSKSLDSLQRMKNLFRADKPHMDI